MEGSILKHALVNAVQHDGKAHVQAVLGKIIAEMPDAGKRIKEILPQIKEIVDDVNSWGTEKQKKKLKDLGIETKKKVAEEITLPPLPGAEMGKVVLRLAPFPSGPLHIGNARMVILNDEYTRKYDGKLLLVVDDTMGSPDKKVVPEAYDMITDGLKWLGIKLDGVFYKSDRLDIFYNAAEEMIKKGFAYVCECDTETLRKKRVEGMACTHRGQNPQENLEKWGDMLAGKYKEGEAIVRLKTDMKYPDPAFRDRVLLRVVEREHPRVGKKYHVWPMLEFSWAVDDHLFGITHIIRGKDLVMEDTMEDFVWNVLRWKKSEFMHYGLLRVKEAKLSKSRARAGIEKGILTGWDDPRTWSLQSLRKRGIQPGALRKFFIGMGMSLADVTVPAEILYAENRKIIDSIANRYFAIFDPVEISVIGGPKINQAEAPLHPDFPDRGKRKIPVNTEKIYVEREDMKRFDGKEVGLINLYSIKLKEKAGFTDRKVKFEIPKIQWVSEPNVKLKLIMPNGSVRIGIADPEIRNVKADRLVQLVRIGFCRVDKVKKQIVLYFAHK